MVTNVKSKLAMFSVIVFLIPLMVEVLYDLAKTYKVILKEEVNGS